jgi:molybdopterin converting factor subunit 1
MIVRVRLFARLRELCDNQSSVELEVAEPATAAAAFAELCRRFPTVQPYRDTLAVAINDEYADWERSLADGDVVALIPPVSGGGRPAGVGAGQRGNLR